MKIYIDEAFVCHEESAPGRRCFETDFFAPGSGEGELSSYGYLPEGESWQRGDGEIFMGEMIWPRGEGRSI